jgi:hypothetical protein
MSITREQLFDAKVDFLCKQSRLHLSVSAFDAKAGFLCSYVSHLLWCLLMKPGTRFLEAAQVYCFIFFIWC